MTVESVGHILVISPHPSESPSLAHAANNSAAAAGPRKSFLRGAPRGPIVSKVSQNRKHCILNDLYPHIDLLEGDCTTAGRSAYSLYTVDSTYAPCLRRP